MVIENLLITPEKFRAYLKALPPGDIVGKSNHACRCPIAIYLNKTTTDCSTVVGCNVMETHFWGDPDHIHQRTIELPVWVQNFIARVDKQHNKEVTAIEALAILDEVYKG